MSIGSEINDLELNLAAAKSMVVRKGGTVGDTGLAGLAQEIANIPYGPVLVTSVEITSPATPSVACTEGDPNVPLSVAVLPANATNKNVIWTSSDTNVITIVQNQQTNEYEAHIVAGGTATVTATTQDGGLTDSVDFVVQGIYGTLRYYSGWGPAWVVDYASNCTASNIDQTTLNSYMADRQSERLSLLYQSRPQTWTDVKTSAVFTTEELAQTTGITAELVGTPYSAVLELVSKIVVDITSPLVSVGVSQEQSGTLCGTGDVLGTIPRGAVYSFAFSNVVTNIGDRFLGECYNLVSLDMSRLTTTTIGDGFLVSCVSFNQPLTLPNGITKINDTFMSGCTAFNQQLTLPNSLTYIDYAFMAGCTAFNQTLTLPDNLTHIGFMFMQNCTSMTATVNVGSIPSSVLESSPRNFAADNPSAPCYVTGITLSGATANDWKAANPDNMSNPYRKLLVATAS